MAARAVRRPSSTLPTDARARRPDLVPPVASAPIRGVDLSIDLAPGHPEGLRLAHPLLVAAGGAGYGIELMASAVSPPAAIVTRGTTLKANAGQEPPRMSAARAGLVSSIGPQNPGVARVLDVHGSRWAAWEIPVVLALCGDGAAAFAALARAADAHSGVAALELHLGCPDLARPRRSSGSAPPSPGAAAAIVAAVHAETELPVIVKLGAWPEVADVAAAAVEAGADAISAIDALPAHAIDRAGRRPALGGIGALSGPALLPVALEVVGRLAAAVRVPIIGIGGVASLGDVLDMLMAGASAVGMTTAALADPALPGRLARELEAWCRAEGIGSVGELVGTASGRRRRPR